MNDESAEKYLEATIRQQPRHWLIDKKHQYLCTRFQQDLGEMLEWLKRHAWKACKPLKGFAGSNPALSAVENTMN